MRILRKVAASLMIIWGGIRGIVDLLESVKATKSYALLIYRLGFRDFAIPTWVALGMILIGILLLFAGRVEEFFHHVEGQPEIRLTATKLPLAQWHTLNGPPPELFRLVHIGGQVAQFVQIEPIISARSKEIRILFDQVDLLDDKVKEASPNFWMEIFPFNEVGAKREAAGGVGYNFFVRDAEKLGEEIIEYPITIKFRWNKRSIEYKVLLVWNHRKKKLTTSPVN